MDVAFILEVEARAAALDALDYFEVLRVPLEAGPAEIKAAYHRESRAYHPDRFASLPSPELRELIASVYRRVNEAYTVLRDDTRRARYLADVSGPDRARRLRFTAADEAELADAKKREKETQLGQTPQGRQFYASALQDVAAERWESAARAVRTALAYEPGNDRFRELLARVEAKRSATSRSEPYKIR